jgi:pimeloyl-ACP methyl ester carboxylesterase
LRAACVVTGLMTLGAGVCRADEQPIRSGALAGTLALPAGRPPAPLALIIPGSGPTDRDGNSTLGIRAAPYRLLAEELAEAGIASIRFDKRGLFDSRAAAPDPNAVTVADYAEDARSWVATGMSATGARCAWLIGHSEGAVVALVAAQTEPHLCGLVLIAAPGRNVGDLLLAQIETNSSNARLVPDAARAIGELKAGHRVDAAALPAPLRTLFRPAIQGFLISLFSYDPAALLRAVPRPVLIVQGTSDLQVSRDDADRLHAAKPDATLAILQGVNHVLKQAPADDRAANLATYAQPDLPLAPEVVPTVARFIASGGKDRPGP